MTGPLRSNAIRSSDGHHHHRPTTPPHVHPISSPRDLLTPKELARPSVGLAYLVLS